MKNDAFPQLHPDSWIDLTRPYITAAVWSLVNAGVPVTRSWLDPRDPRDATIVYSSPATVGERALVWDEVTGWRYGRYEFGSQGTRTSLSDVSHLGGGVLLDGTDLVSRLISGASAPQRQYRQVTDLHDGLDDALSSPR
jgi:hypothetical protein